MKRDVRDAGTIPMAKSRMEARGIEVSYLCPSVTDRGHAVGMVSAEFLRRESLPRQDGTTAVRLQSSSRRIYALLRSVMRERGVRTMVAALLAGRLSPAPAHCSLPAGARPIYGRAARTRFATRAPCA